ncbi:MAG: phytoene/squalene synthase family protein [Isosphaeraceae bacterium]|nr:phytoene/squalene synthase family protein [Isosphaeraceae bacterium]
MNDALRASYRFCTEVSRREARNFYYSFLLLPAERRSSMCALYAFLRRTDDLADEPGPAAEKRAALDAWRAELERTLAGGSSTTWPGFAALADTVRRHEIPARYLHEVIDGVLMDLDPHPYSTFDDLHGYCYHVASAVGLACVHIWGFESAGGEAESRAEACGLALQLTNILRDVGEDARNGRVYLPQEDLDRFGVSTADLVAGRVSEPLRALLTFEADRAYRYYEQAALLERLVAPEGRPALRAIIGIYRTLLDTIVKRDYEVLATRVAVPGWRKAAVALRSLAGRFTAPAPTAAAGSPRS